MSKSRLGTILLKAGQINQEQLDQLSKATKKHGSSFCSELVKQNIFSSEDELANFLSESSEYPVIDLSNNRVDLNITKLTVDIMLKYHALPIHRNGNVITLAVADPYDDDCLDIVSFILGCQVNPVISTESLIHDRVTTYGKTEPLYIAKPDINVEELIESRNKGIAEQIKNRVSNGADVNAENVYGMTALHDAASIGQQDLVEWLVEHGANMNAKDKFNRTAVHYAAFNRSWELVEWLIKHGADMFAIDLHGRMAPFDATLNGKKELIERLGTLDIGCKDEVGRKDMFEWFNSFDEKEAARYIKYYIINPLKNAPPYRMDNYIAGGMRIKNASARALFWAVQKDKKELVEWLIEHGADVKITALNGKTLLDFAEELGNQETIGLLREQDRLMALDARCKPSIESFG